MVSILPITIKSPNARLHKTTRLLPKIRTYDKPNNKFTVKVEDSMFSLPSFGNEES